jgi:hypothetical protein
MHGNHWANDDFIDHLYGVGPEDGHLEACASCAERWEEIRRRHESFPRAIIDVSHESLAAQRRAIFQRIGNKRHHLPRILVPALATLLLVSFLVVNKPSPSRAPAVNQASDSQLFEEVFRRASTPESTAVGPIRSLFEEQK